MDSHVRNRQTGNEPLKGWYRRGFMHPPHFDAGDVPQFVTFRLADSLPQERLAQWKDLLESKQIEVLEVRRRIERFLDSGFGMCYLKNPRIATIVQDALHHFDGDRYRLHGWCVMPNHVHVLFTPTAGYQLAAIVQSWKSYSAKMANRLLERTGEFWQNDFFDRYIRDQEQLDRVLWYIAENPVKAKLCDNPSEWPYGHARLLDHEIVQ